MRRVVIVGNGFIHHLKSLVEIQQERHKNIDNFIGRNGVNRCSRIVQELQKVSELFSAFDSLQKELTHFFSDKVKYEELFERLDALIAWYKSKNEFKNIIDDKCFNGLEVLIEKIINEKILPIVGEFEEQEIRGVYADLFRLIPGTTIGDRVAEAQKASGDKIGIFTTNYDGYLAQLLRTSSGDSDGFHFFDGFGGGKYGHFVVPYEPYFSDNNFLASLHSSYRIGYVGEELIKTRPRQGERNKLPILVYMNPQRKLSYIKKHYILRRYWESFENWLKDADEVVVYGNSLRSDPHIVSQLNREVAKSGRKLKIYAAGRSPASVMKQLTFEKGLQPELKEIETKGVNLDNLHKLFTSPAELV